MTISNRARAAFALGSLMLISTPASRADSPWLYGIHWWGYTQGQALDNGPCQLLDCATHGGWTVETVLTHSASWWAPAHFVPMYTELYNNKKMSILTRIDFNWGETVPNPNSSAYATWPATVVNAVNTLRHGSHLWIIGNEPNITIEGENWPNKQITPAAYATIYRNVRNAVHANALPSPTGPHRVLIAAPSPGGIIPGIRWMDGNQWLSQVLDNIPANEVDGVALHAYGNVTEFRNTYSSQLAVIDSKGLRQVPVYITEWNHVAAEATMAQTIRNCFLDLKNWNATPGNHNIIALCWFVYDADQQAGGGWNSYAIEWYRNNGIPQGDPNNVYTAFEQTVDQRYPAGQIGTPGLTTMARSPSSFTRSVYEGDNLPNDTFTVQNTASGAMAYTITDNVNWLSVSPASGSSSGEVDTLTITYAVAGLLPGQHNATITITAASAGNSPQTIAVNLTVQPSPYAPVDNDRDGDVDQSDFGWFQGCYTGPGIPQNNPACEKARLDGDSDVDLDDFALFQQCVSGPNQPASPDCAE